MKLDAHVHTHYSANTPSPFVRRFLKESYNTPEKLYRCAKARGMDLVTITDHDSIAGALSIADREDVIVGCEVTATFPEDGVQCHIGVLDITEAQHNEIQKLRHNIHELVSYLKQQKIFSTLNHLAPRTAGELNAGHICSLLPWINAIETRNGTRLPSQNRTATALASSYGKVTVAGSDSHTYRGIGHTYMVLDGVSNREEFLAGLWEGRVRVEGEQGSYLTLASDVLRLTARFYADGATRLIEQPLSLRRHLMFLCAMFGLPLAVVGIVGSFVHYIQDEQFNQTLLLDLVTRPNKFVSPPSVRVFKTAV